MKKLIASVVFPALVLSLHIALAETVAQHPGAPSVLAGNSYAAIAERLTPFGMVDTTGQASQQNAGVLVERDGKSVYEAVCYVCHASGSVGSPKFGCAKSWQPRAQKGMNVLLQHAFHGLNFMPPRGGCMDCTDNEIKAAVQYMVDNSKTNETCL